MLVLAEAWTDVQVFQGQHGMFTRQFALCGHELLMRVQNLRGTFSTCHHLRTIAFGGLCH